MIILDSKYMSLKYIKREIYRSPFGFQGMRVYETNRVISSWLFLSISFASFGVSIISTAAVVGTLTHFLTKEKEYIIIPCSELPNCDIPISM